MVEKNKKRIPKKKQFNRSKEEGKICALLAYLLIGIIWYFADEEMKKNDFVKFHVKQGLWLLILAIIASLIVSIIPFIGWLIALVLRIVFIVLMIIGIINALNLERKELPIIGEYAEKIFNF